MIKVCLIDADTPLGGEILRLLINHPDVEITGLCSQLNRGEYIQSVHHGFVGEKQLTFCVQIPPDSTALIYCGQNSPTEQIRARASKGSIKIIDLSRDSYLSNRVGTVVPAISEIFRKPLVRGASETCVLSPLETVLLIALFPLARNLMLSSALDVEVEINKSAEADLDLKRAGELAGRLLHAIQQSFTHSVNFNIKTTLEEQRGLRLKTKLKLSMPINDLRPLYDEVYDDHSFTFLQPTSLDLREVINTNKCLLNLNRISDDEITVEAISDVRMRGWAGEALLALNLMFGLYEKTGLQLKSSSY